MVKEKRWMIWFIVGFGIGLFGGITIGQVLMFNLFAMAFDNILEDVQIDNVNIELNETLLAEPFVEVLTYYVQNDQENNTGKKEDLAHKTPYMQDG